MKAVTDVFVRHPVLALVVNLALILVGVRTAINLPVQQYPRLDSASILVNTVYVGASAETVRGFLTTPIERAVASIGGVDHIESQSRASLSQVTIRLELGYDTTRALAEVTAQLQQIRSDLPTEAEPPTVEVQRADRPYASFYLSFTSEERSLAALTDYLTRSVQPELATTPGVQRVTNNEGGQPFPTSSPHTTSRRATSTRPSSATTTSRPSARPRARTSRSACWPTPTSAPSRSSRS